MSPTKVFNGLVLIWPDTHVPYQHKLAVKNYIEYIAVEQPALLLLTGDFLDLEPISRWAAETLDENGALFNRELDEGRKILRSIREVYDGPMAWLPGNHEERLVKWGRTRGKAIFGLRELTIPGLLNFDEFEVQTPGGVFEAERPYAFAPDTLAVHGEWLMQNSGYTAHKHVRMYGSNVVHGHTHRLAVVYQSNLRGQHWGIEAGHLMDQSQASYLRTGAADWQMGFAGVEVWKGKTKPFVTPMAPNGSFWIGDVHFGGQR